VCIQWAFVCTPCCANNSSPSSKHNISKRAVCFVVLLLMNRDRGLHRHVHVSTHTHNERAGYIDETEMKEKEREKEVQGKHALERMVLRATFCLTNMHDFFFSSSTPQSTFSIWFPLLGKVSSSVPALICTLIIKQVFITICLHH